MTTLDKTFKAEVDYVMQYGGRCRDCADNYGTCPVTNLPCAPDEARAAIQHILKAVAYGREHGYLDALSIPEQGVWAPYKDLPLDEQVAFLEDCLATTRGWCDVWKRKAEALAPSHPAAVADPLGIEAAKNSVPHPVSGAPTWPEAAAVAVTDEMVDLVECEHCHGTGQPGGIMGGPEHGLCSWCSGTGMQRPSAALVHQDQVKS